MILARGPLLMKEKNNRLWEAPWDRRWQQRYFLLQGGQLYVYELRSFNFDKERAEAKFDLSKCAGVKCRKPKMVELHLKFRSKGQLYLKAKNPAECAEWHRQLTSAMSNARRICQRMEASMSRSTITPSANKPIRRSSGGDCSQWYGFGLPRLTVTGTGPIIRPSETQCRPSVPVVGFPSTKFPTAKQSGLVRSFLQSIAEHGTVRTAQDWQNLSEVIRARRRPDFTRFQLEPAKLLRPVAGWVPDPLHPGFCTAQPQD